MNEFILQWHPSSGGMWFINNTRSLWKLTKKYEDYPSHHQLLYLDKIIKDNPNTKIVHLIRDGINSVFGRIKRNHGEEINKCYEENMTFEQYKELPKHQRMAYVWKWMMENAIKFRNNSNYYELKYEDLIGNTSQCAIGTETIDKLFTFLEIENNEMKQKLISSANKDALFRWKDYPIEQVKEVYNIIKDIRLKVGYEKMEELE